MDFFIGLLLVIIAGFFQGSFVLPMTFTRSWSWEHTWAAFSFFGMFFLNGIVALMLVPNLVQVYRAMAPSLLCELALLGAGWGVGAILFGLGMDKLGLALGYPIIMGLIASLGTAIPLLLFFSGQLLAAKALFTLAGTAIVIVGIVLCSIAGTRKRPQTEPAARTASDGFGLGLLIAIFAGVFSCLPNVGLAVAARAVAADKNVVTASSAVGNSVWPTVFAAGFVVNFAYCLYMMHRKKGPHVFCNHETGRNLLLTALMGALWIGSFYLYGLGAARLGKWGAVIGWPIFISLSIAVGGAWGIWRGEWRGAPLRARRLLNLGIVVLLLAVVAIAGGNLF